MCCSNTCLALHILSVHIYRFWGFDTCLKQQMHELENLNFFCRCRESAIQRDSSMWHSGIFSKEMEGTRPTVTLLNNAHKPETDGQPPLSWNQAFEVGVFAGDVGTMWIGISSNWAQDKNSAESDPCQHAAPGVGSESNQTVLSGRWRCWQRHPTITIEWPQLTLCLLSLVFVFAFVTIAVINWWFSLSFFP